MCFLHNTLWFLQSNLHNTLTIHTQCPWRIMHLHIALCQIHNFQKNSCIMVNMYKLWMILSARLTDDNSLKRQYMLKQTLEVLTCYRSSQFSGPTNNLFVPLFFLVAKQYHMFQFLVSYISKLCWLGWVVNMTWNTQYGLVCSLKKAKKKNPRKTQKHFYLEVNTTSMMKWIR